MTTWYGNETGRQVTTTFLNPKSEDRSCFLTGPHGIGKRSFILETVSSLSQEDVIVVEPGVEGARNVVEFLSTDPIIDSFRVAVVIGADLMQLPSQDAYLKVLEEPPPKSKIIFLSDDEGLLSAPLKSRARMYSRWTCLSDSDMRAFAVEYGQVDEVALSFSCGRPGIYCVIRNDQRIAPLYAAVIDAVLGNRDLLLEKVPIIISELDSKSPIRMAVSCIIKKAANACVGKVDSRRVIPALKYASLIASSPSVNMELHYLRMISELHSPV
jgi:hypothetical protein